MGEIYANSICAAAALTARNSHKDCFFDDTRNPLFFCPCRISDRWYVKGNPNVGIDLRVGLSALPLHTRAWVVQERILADTMVSMALHGNARNALRRKRSHGAKSTDSLQKRHTSDEGRLSPRKEAVAPRWEEVDWDADVKAAAGDCGKELQCLLIARLSE
ncbi:hypothetical protein JVT61DRAFT_855 [Boletus reticuloceps]|uniref:Uncharacterized protein n=1 Tax=Boletus reticuloceps TaxID=495285 RepID=A0A8I2Z3R5_9AGAM|nr:hypothetical protein JVT61DRAFT_855 [Boletus reticuloceps]